MESILEDYLHTRALDPRRLHAIYMSIDILFCSLSQCHILMLNVHNEGLFFNLCVVLCDGNIMTVFCCDRNKKDIVE